MSIVGAPVAQAIPREIVGAISAIFTGGAGPSGQYIDSAMEAAGLDSAAYTGNKAVRVRDGLSARPPQRGWTMLDELVHVLRDHGYFDPRPLPGDMVRLQSAIGMFGGRLTDGGHMTWGTSVGDAIGQPMEGRPTVSAPRMTLTIPEAAPPPPLAQPADPTIPSHERLLWLLERVPQSFSALVQRRRQGHTALTLADEYDLQDATETALRLLYDDIRPEERNPSYAGRSSTQDFLLYEVKTMVEIKVTRPGRGNVAIRDEIVIDSEIYRAHPDVERMVFVVYDIAATIRNPSGFEQALSTPIDGYARDTLVVPWPYPVAPGT